MIKRVVPFYLSRTPTHKMNKIVTSVKSIVAALLLYLFVSVLNYAVIKALFAWASLQQGNYNHSVVSRLIFVLLILSLACLINTKSHREMNVFVILGMIFGSILIPATSFFILIYLFYLFFDNTLGGKKPQ